MEFQTRDKVLDLLLLPHSSTLTSFCKDKNTCATMLLYKNQIFFLVIRISCGSHYAIKKYTKLFIDVGRYALLMLIRPYQRFEPETFGLLCRHYQGRPILALFGLKIFFRFEMKYRPIQIIVYN